MLSILCHFHGLFSVRQVLTNQKAAMPLSVLHSPHAPACPAHIDERTGDFASIEEDG